MEWSTNFSEGGKRSRIVPRVGEFDIDDQTDLSQSCMVVEGRVRSEDNVGFLLYPRGLLLAFTCL